MQLIGPVGEACFDAISHDALRWRQRDHGCGGIKLQAVEQGHGSIMVSLEM